jgi:hypothetical protein
VQHPLALSRKHRRNRKACKVEGKKEKREIKKKENK